MSKIEQLEQRVRQLYSDKNPERADWADWLSEHHVFVVADNASRLARRFGGNEEMARAAGMLHDIADTRMSRFTDEHEGASLAIGRRLMAELGYSDDEIKLVIDDAVRYHSCHNGQVPASLEGKILAAADSLAHLQTDFYIYATWSMAKDESLEQIKKWVLKKIDRDFNAKLMFDEVKDELRQDYLALNQLFKLN